MYLDYATQGRDVFTIDIEGDSLTPTVLWCMCWENVLTGETGDCVGLEEILRFFELNNGSIFIGHNILKFDAPVLARFGARGLGVSSCIDTLVLSTLYSPSLSGGHSLGNWGQILGFPKGDHHDFSRFTPEMLRYCQQDVRITTELFKKLTKVLTKIGFSELSIWLQHRFQVIIDRQQRNGFMFDGPRAMSLYSTLREREGVLGEEINDAFPPELEEIAEYKRAYKQDGSLSAQFVRHSEAYEKCEVLPDGAYRVFGRTPFNIGSPKQRVEKLTSLGWIPLEFTPKGTPKPFDKGKLSPSLEKFLEDKDVPEVALIAKWMSINGRANMIRTWLNEWDEEDGCIHGSLFVADTLRLRHSAPNTANIPAVRSDKQGNVIFGESGYYTYESRDLWVARPNRVLVGTDAAGLELRMLAHYLNRPAFSDVVINGDPHQFNADAVGITRPEAKTLIYAIQYGAQGPKVAKMLGVSNNEGANVRSMFLERLGLDEIMEVSQYEQRTGRISLVDGSKVVCPSPHSALNYKLQGGGARVMALGAVFLAGHIRRKGLDSLKVGDIHDEWQHDVLPSDASEHGRLAVQSIVEAGEELNLHVPLDGTSKEGRTWAETH